MTNAAEKQVEPGPTDEPYANPFIGADSEAHLDDEIATLQREIDATPALNSLMDDPPAPAHPADDPEATADPGADPAADPAVAADQVADLAVAADPAADPEADPAATPEVSPGMVPKARLDAKNRIIEDLNRRLSEAKGDAPPARNNEAIAVDIEDKLGDPTEMFDAILDGKVAEAGTMFQSIMKDVANATAQQMAGVVDAKVTDGNAQATQQSLYDSAVDRAFADHPSLDPDNAAFDAVASRAITSYQQTLVQSGEASPHEAVHQAVKDLMPKMGAIGGVPETPATPATPATTAAADKARAGQAAKTAEKVKTIADGQPPATQTSALDGTEGIDIETMTLDEIDALPEAMLKRLRGDEGV